MYEARLERQAVRVIPVDHERLRGGGGVEGRAVRPSGSNEGGVPEQHIVFHREVASGGDGNRIPERPGKTVAQYCARETDVLEVLIAEPGSGSNCDTDPIEEVYLAKR